jgi:hypothetical protein
VELFIIVSFVFSSTVGSELWKILLSLNKTYDVIRNAVIITSDVISKNGFRIEVNEGKRYTCNHNSLNG